MNLNQLQPRAIICAGQRCGTTALHEVFRNNAIFCPGEVLDPNLPGKESYHYFLKNETVSVSEYCKNPIKYWEKYIAYLIDIFNDREIVLDIKYNSWYQFDGAWQHPGSRPRLLDVLHADCWIIHVVREDVFSQAMSHVVAEERGKYHNIDEVDLTEMRLMVDIGQFRERVCQINTSKKYFFKWLEGRKKVVLLRYEELFFENNLTERSKSELEMIGLKIDDVKTCLRKPKTNYSVMVENYAEITDVYQQIK